MLEFVHLVIRLLVLLSEGGFLPLVDIVVDVILD